MDRDLSPRCTIRGFSIRCGALRSSHSRLARENAGNRSVGGGRLRDILIHDTGDLCPLPSFLCIFEPLNHVLYLSLFFLICPQLPAKRTATPDFEKRYKRYCSARTNAQKAREMSFRSDTHQKEIADQQKNLQRDFLGLQKTIRDVSSSRNVFILYGQRVFFEFFSLSAIMHTCAIFYFQRQYIREKHSHRHFPFHDYPRSAGKS